MAAISATRNPDRIFALTLVGQYSFAAVGFFGMAYVFQIFGIQGAYVIIGAMALSVVLTVGWFPHTIQAAETSGVKSGSLFTFPVILTLSSLLIFYVANNAIWAYTINGAWQDFMEKEKGIIKRGYLADFCVLDQEIMTAEAHTLEEMNVVMTIVGGKIVYDVSDEE